MLRGFQVRVRGWRVCCTSIVRPTARLMSWCLVTSRVTRLYLKPPGLSLSLFSHPLLDNTLVMSLYPVDSP